MFSTKDASRTLNDEGRGVKHKDHTTTALKTPNLAVGTMGKNVDSAATSSQPRGKPSNPNPISISINRWFPSLMQVPKQNHNGGQIYMNFREHNAPISKHHYPFPFVDLRNENFEEPVVEEEALSAVGPLQT